jgi:hypothetical protein
MSQKREIRRIKIPPQNIMHATSAHKNYMIILSYNNGEKHSNLKNLQPERERESFIFLITFKSRAFELKGEHIYQTTIENISYI